MILVNDQFLERDQIKIDIEDRGYQFGDGVYEVIRIYNGKFFEGEAHLIRLQRSLDELRIQPPYDLTELQTKLGELCVHNRLENGMIYLQITRGQAERTHAYPNDAKSVLTAYTKPLVRPLKDLEEGIKTCLTEDIRWLRCDIKSLNLLGNVLAKQKAVEGGYKEAIFHRGDDVTEGSSSNVFIIKGNTLITHPATNYILNGITRLWVLKQARALGMTVKEAVFSVEELLQAEEAFITSTTQEIMPICEIEGKQVGEGVPGSLTRGLQKAFDEAILSL
ncbi:MAG TPA: D-amino-acid transaminase [Sporolactobacillaceae bacterium]|nr:D-amino-acid transaminase [Sporolactobacillaceae bacterium]